MDRKMCPDGLRTGVQFRKYVIIRPIKLCYRSVHNHPFLVGILLFVLFLYRLSPFVFSLLVSASPVLVCTALLLGTLLTFGQPNVPEIEEDESCATEIASLKTDKSESATVFERDVNFGGDEHGWFTEVRNETLEGAIDYLSSQGDTDKVTKFVEDDDFSHDLMLADRNSLEFQLGQQFAGKLDHASETLDVDERKGNDGNKGEDTRGQFEMRREMAGDVIVDTSLQNDHDEGAKCDLDDGLAHDLASADHTAPEVQFGKHVIDEGHQFKNLNIEDQEQNHGRRMGVVDECVSRDGQVDGSWYADLPNFNHENLAKGSSIAFARDDLESSFVAWKQMDNDYHDGQSSDSGSDGAESSSPDASMADILPMLDELDPLIDTENPQDVTEAHESFVMNEEVSDKSDEISIGSDEESDHKEEDGAADDCEEKKDSQGGKESAGESAILWTEDDQKNLMELGISELERNQRLESLIARRRARRNMRMMTERNLIDFDGMDLSFEVTPISTRRNPFDFHQDSYDDLGLPPIPGSAPSDMLPRRNPFDLPYDSNEEKPDLMGDSFQEEFMQLNRKESVFRRHESFNIGSSNFEFPRYKSKGIGQASRFRPFFVPEGTSYSSFQRMPSDLSESKASSAAETFETESTSVVGDQDEMRPTGMSIFGDEVTMGRHDHEPVFETNVSHGPTEHEIRSPEDVSSVSTISSESDASSASDNDSVVTSVAGDERGMKADVDHFRQEGEPVFNKSHSFDGVEIDVGSAFHALNELKASSSTVIVDWTVTSKFGSEKDEVPTDHAVAQAAGAISELYHASDHVDCGVDFQSSGFNKLESSSAADVLTIVDAAELKLAAKDTGEVKPIYDGHVQGVETNSLMDSGIHDVTGDSDLMPSSAADLTDKEFAIMAGDPEDVNPADRNFVEGMEATLMHHVECRSELVLDGISELESSSYDMESTTIPEFQEEMKSSDSCLVQQVEGNIQTDQASNHVESDVDLLSGGLGDLKEMSAADIPATQSIIRAVDTSQSTHDMDHILDDSEHVDNLLSVNDRALKAIHAAEIADDERTAVSGDLVRIKLHDHAKEAVNEASSLIVHAVDPVSSAISELKSSSAVDTADIGSVSIAGDQNVTNPTFLSFDKEVGATFKSDGYSDIVMHNDVSVGCGHGEFNMSSSSITDAELTAAGGLTEELKKAYNDLAQGLETTSHLLCTSSPVNHNAHLLSSASESEVTAAEMANVESIFVAQNQEENNPTDHDIARDTDSGDAVENDVNRVSGELNTLRLSSASDIADIDSKAIASDPEEKMSAEHYFFKEVEVKPACEMKLPASNRVAHDIKSVPADTAETNSSAVGGYQVEISPIYDVIAEDETAYGMDDAAEHHEHEKEMDSGGLDVLESVSDGEVSISGSTLVGVKQKEGKQTDCVAEAEISPSSTNIFSDHVEHLVNSDSSFLREMTSISTVVQSLLGPDDLDKKPTYDDLAQEVGSMSVHKPDSNDQVLYSISKSTSEPMASSSTEIDPIQKALGAVYQEDIKPTDDDLSGEEKPTCDMNCSDPRVEQESRPSQDKDSSVSDQHMRRDCDINVAEVDFDGELENHVGIELNSDNVVGDKKVEPCLSEERVSKVESGLSERRDV